MKKEKEIKIGDIVWIKKNSQIGTVLKVINGTDGNRRKNDEFAEQISNLKDEIHRCNEKYQRTKQLEREDSPLYKIGEIVMHANTQTMYTVKNIQKNNNYLYMYELALPIKASDISSTNDLFQIVSESEITHTTKNQKRTYVGLSHYWYQEAMRQHEVISALNRNEKSLSYNLASAKKYVETLIAEKDKLIGQTKSQDITISCQANELSENYKEIDRLTKKCQDIRHELFTLQAHEYNITQDLKNKIMENYNTRGYIHYAEYISRHFLVSILQFLHIVKTYDRYSDISFLIKLSPDGKDIQGTYRQNPDNQETEEINKSERNDKDGSEI